MHKGVWGVGSMWRLTQNIEVIVGMRVLEAGDRQPVKSAHEDDDVF